MLNPNERNLNLKWHKLREEDLYLEPIKEIQKITVFTNINNIYWYTRAVMEDYPQYPSEPVLWETSKNWEPLMKEIEDPNNPDNNINVRVLKDLTTLEPLLSEFYNVLDPTTLKPVEVPVKVVLN